MGLLGTEVGSPWDGNRVVVVGSEGGIGASLVSQLKDCSAVVTSLDKASGFDATDPGDVRDVFDAQKCIDTVIYAAGIACSGLLTGDSSAQDLVDVYKVNVVGAANVARASADFLHASAGRFVTLNSAFSLVTAEGFGSYSASKAALGVVTEALRPELSPATVTDCLVGGVRTAIFATAADRAGTAASREVNRRFLNRTARISPDDAAARILKAAWLRRKRPAIGVDAHIVRRLTHLAPSTTQDLVRRLIGEYPSNSAV